jgi:hypothetical protein
MAWAISALKGGAERMGRGTISRRRGQAMRSTRLPWAWRSRPEASGWRLRQPKVAAAAASCGVQRHPEEEEARVAGWATWARPRWLGGLGQLVGQGRASGGDKAAQEEGRGDGPGQGGSPDGGEEGAGQPGGERGQAPAGLG